MTNTRWYEVLFKEINRQLESHQIIVKMVLIIDASVVETPLKPKGKTNHKVTQDREDEQEVKVEKQYPASVDQEASWLEKGQPLTYWEKKFNKLVGKVRFKVERTFGSIKRWFNGGVARYRGISKMHTQNLMEAMSYNLYRSPGIVASNSKN